MRGWVLGDQEKAPVAMREPYLDFVEPAAFASARREIQILLALEAIVL
jgi:hypothetical protein